MVHLEGMGLRVRFTRGTQPAFRDGAWVRTWPEGRLRTTTLFPLKKKVRVRKLPMGHLCTPRSASQNPYATKNSNSNLKMNSKCMELKRRMLWITWR